MRTSTTSARNTCIALIFGALVLFGFAPRAHAQAPLVPGPLSVPSAVINRLVGAQNSLQNPGCSWNTLSFQDCVYTPLAVAAGTSMLALGGSILRLSGAIFDFGVNHVIIDFKNTLSGPLIEVINAGWTFFRDLANILIIGIFTFIAISLILGLKEYGQKKLVARVLIIAVLMNFSLLFTKIIIDASNFTAYAIYTQTAGAGGTTFSVADKVLAPLRISSVWDTASLTQRVANDGASETKAWRALSFGVFGFILLAVLAAVIFYGAFLIIARAAMFVILMLTAPIAYASYLAPHFESSTFGWTNWWKSLINNAAFAPLMMVFLSISILIMQTASSYVGNTGTLGMLLDDPAKQVATDGWRILFVYLIGTGLLFASFRLSSSLAGSISGIRMGQMAAGIPLALGFAGLAKGAQYTVGRQLSKAADNKAAQAQAMHMQALNSGKAEDFARAEKLRKEKDMLDKASRSSFNLMNTSVGKSLTGGLGGFLGGQTKGSFKDDMHARGEAALDKAKAAQVSDKDKKAIRDNAAAELKKHEQELETAKASMKFAEAALEQARRENAAANDPELKKQAENNRKAREPELERAKQEVKVVEEKRTEIVAGHDAEIKTMMRQAEGMQGQAHDEQIRAIEARKAEHATELNKQTERIKVAREKLTTIEFDVDEPKRVLEQRQQKAAAELTLREKEHSEKKAAYSTLTKQTDGIKKEVKEMGNKAVARAESHAEQELHRIADKAAGISGGTTGSHEIHHVFEEKFKKKSSAESISAAIEKITKKGADGEAHA